MDLEALGNYGVITCRSCRDAVANWSRIIKPFDHSHLLPKGRFKDLELDPDNLKHRCRDCHDALDRRDWEAINNFRDLDDIMTYLEKVAPLEYNKFVTGLQSIRNFNYKYIE